VIDVPSSLGLGSAGTEGLPAALRRAGLASRLGADDGAVVSSAATHHDVRDSRTLLLNGPGIRAIQLELAAAVAATIERGAVPLVLAGDCSVVLGGLLGMRRAMARAGRGARPGLLFVDGHVDFYQPEASPTGEVADMDLAIATGRGPAILTELDGAGPLVRDEDVAAIGARDTEERDLAGSQDIRTTGITLIELPEIRKRGIAAAAEAALKVVTKTSRFWCHVDADVLDDAVMPAVDYRQPGGLTPSELATLLRKTSDTNRMAGLSVAIYNPELDPDGRCARVLADTIVDGFGVR